MRGKYPLMVLGCFSLLGFVYFEFGTAPVPVVDDDTATEVIQDGHQNRGLDSISDLNARTLMDKLSEEQISNLTRLLASGERKAMADYEMDMVVINKAVRSQDDIVVENKKFGQATFKPDAPYFKPATSHAPFCAVIPASAKPAYREMIMLMAKTFGKDAAVNSWLFFNGDDFEEQMQDIDSMCNEVMAEGTRMRCVVSKNTTCGRGKGCAAHTMFTGFHEVAADMVKSCDWIIKLDPDCVFSPKAALQFVKGLDPQRRVFYGTFSGKLVHSGSPNIWLSTQMPKGNWMVSIGSWRRMMRVALTEICAPHGQWTGTDEAAAVLCAWYSWGAQCMTNWRDYVRIGPTGNSEKVLGEHMERMDKWAKWDCVMLVHKYPLNRTIELYNRLQNYDHANRHCGSEGLQLQQSRDDGHNEEIVFGYKFPNLTKIFESYDCAGQHDVMETSGVRLIPAWVVEEGRVYKGVPPGQQDKSKCKPYCG
eukprot:m.133649 g.133649  ORF g.133649 m.133649 type:complete len:478 (-) comp29687_c0_seq1:26-1459(-)